MASSYVRKTYDVFLSFRGEDTRRSFTDHLYYRLTNAGVHTFRDDERLERGYSISPSLLHAIEESRISIVVFSKNYAGSRWCLDELVKIMDCKDGLNQIVFPVFYDVDPSEVRKQRGEFGDALAQHRERFGDQKVNEWKVALTEASNLSGWDLQTMTNGFEAKLIELIIDDVLRVLNFMPKNVAKHPVGMIDSRARDILNLLQNQTNDGVRMIGIFGMSGLEKSTIAKAIYNHLIMSFQGFECGCFVANIRPQVSKGQRNRRRSLPVLQRLKLALLLAFWLLLVSILLHVLLLSFCSDSNRLTIKAPGRNQRTFRDVFQLHPASSSSSVINIAASSVQDSNVLGLLV